MESIVSIHLQPGYQFQRPNVEVRRAIGGSQRLSAGALSVVSGSQRLSVGALRLDARRSGPSPVSSPAGADSLFFVLPKKSKQKKGAPEMATPP